MKISQKIYIGFGFVIFFAIVDLIVNYQLSNKVIRNMEFLSRSETILRNSNRLHKSIIQMQSGLRGYLLAEKETFLDSYYAGLKEIPPILREEREIVKGNAEQLRCLDSIAMLHTEWIEYANALIKAKQESLETIKGKEVYMDLFEKKQRRGVGQQLNDIITLKFKEFDQYEYYVRNRRQQRLRDSIRYTNFVSASLAIGYITIAIITGFLVVKTITRRIYSMVSLAEKISQGTFSVIKDQENDELTQLSLSLNVMSQKLQHSFSVLTKRNQELDQFAYVVSHDLKAPLRGMYNILQWIEEDLESELSDQLKKYHTKMRGRIIRLESLINGLLQYARIGRKTESVEIVHVGQIVQDIVELLVPAGCKVNLPSAMPVLQTKRLYLEQVFSNLISNAVKYSKKEDCIITIDCIDVGEYYQFSVKDNGIGIAPEYHQKIFTIFQTLREKNEAESTGIGLSIVKKIVGEQEGEIWLTSQLGEGSVFTFTWPKFTSLNNN
ncbi:sensor histidine kinase [Xanthocytophaga flava]|uniref:sensor histidine kinase n=1 Tax=Xanthocytophaga flava TaxID=3048013 RepID=UPI0028D4405F|nr:ATP-binding protein [Xanthocytophaga flavus]MDJ1469846.1 ATP-binding protein [Xanthocytophaga flavus]